MIERASAIQERRSITTEYNGNGGAEKCPAAIPTIVTISATFQEKN